MIHTIALNAFSGRTAIRSFGRSSGPTFLEMSNTVWVTFTHYTVPEPGVYTRSPRKQSGYATTHALPIAKPMATQPRP